MAQVKAIIPQPIKNELQELAKSQNKSEAACIREAVKNYLSVKKAPR